MVEIFDDRIEITNPGEPLVDPQRFVDTPPRSRNEILASLMRRFRICEERGSGIDKVVSQVELFQLPVPLFEQPDGFTRTVLFAHKPLSAMDKTDRVRACYLRACLRYVMRQPMTNTSVRKRFVSRLQPLMGKLSAACTKRSHVLLAIIATASKPYAVMIATRSQDWRPGPAHFGLLWRPRWQLDRDLVLQ